MLAYKIDKESYVRNILMKGTIRYLAGIAGPSGFGSKSTAEQVTEGYCNEPSAAAAAVNSSSNYSHHHCPSPQLTAIITGATSGIGAETARVMAKRGIRIVIPARNLQKATQVKERILRETPSAEIILMEVDLSCTSSVVRFCSQFISLGLPLQILINNAGVFSQDLEYSKDKIEMTFATNYLGHFVLTEMLLDKMIETAEMSGIEGRIINVSSVIHSWVKPQNFNFHQILNPKHYNGTRAYAQSKLANILHAKEIARQLKARNARVCINAIHPGIVKTGIIRAHKGFITDSLFFLTSKLLKSIPQGAATTCYVALSKDTRGISGSYFSDCNLSCCSALANDAIQAHRLYQLTRALLSKRHFDPQTFAVAR